MKDGCALAPQLSALRAKHLHVCDAGVPEAGGGQCVLGVPEGCSLACGWGFVALVSCVWYEQASRDNGAAATAPVPGLRCGTGSEGEHGHGWSA